MKKRPPNWLELAVQATTDTRHGYNLLAPRFELTPYATQPELIEACRARVDALYPIERSQARGADLACGTGLGCVALWKSCAEVDGYDFSPGMLAEARQRFCHCPGVRFHEGDLATLALPEGVYDRIVCFGAWGHVLPDWRDRLLRQIVASLTPSGVFYTLTADPVGPTNLGWWRASLFDTAITLRNRLLGDPFHMYYRINDTLTLKRSLEAAGDCEVRLEPLPRDPHPRLTLMMVRRKGADQLSSQEMSGAQNGSLFQA